MLDLELGAGAGQARGDLDVRTDHEHAVSSGSAKAACCRGDCQWQGSPPHGVPIPARARDLKDLRARAVRSVTASASHPPGPENLNRIPYDIHWLGYM